MYVKDEFFLFRSNAWNKLLPGFQIVHKFVQQFQALSCYRGDLKNGANFVCGNQATCLRDHLFLFSIQLLLISNHSDFLFFSFFKEGLHRNQIFRLNHESFFPNILSLHYLLNFSYSFL